MRGRLAFMDMAQRPRERPAAGEPTGCLAESPPTCSSAEAGGTFSIVGPESTLSGSSVRRSLLTAALALLAALALPVAAAAKHPPPATPILDTATASGDNLVLDDFSAFEIEVDAHSGPSGENPGGSVSFNPLGILPISGPVTCLDVSGNTAVMTVAGPFPARPGFTAFFVKLTDNGGSGLDRFEYWPWVDEIPLPSDCRTATSDYFGGPLIGRAVVTDADADDQPPVPTSRKQCRHGGFARFGFPSKRQCIKYVNRHRHR